MKKIVLFLSFVLFSLLGATAQEENHSQTQFNKVSYTSLPELEASAGEGLSGEFAGEHHGRLIVAGGSNFPSPLVEGGKKVYYDEIRTLPLNSSQNAKWEVVGHLPSPMAYGLSFTVPDGVLCVGGMDADSSFSSVLLLSYKDHKVEIKQLPSLPIPLDQMAGAYGNGKIFITAGQSNALASRKTFCADYETLIQAPTHSSVWQHLPDLPNTYRLQPCGIIQKAAVGAKFYVFGGFDPIEHHIVQNAISFDLTTNKWDHVIPMSEDLALIGATAMTSGSQQIIFFGGVNAEIFQSALNRVIALEEAIKTSSDEIIEKIQVQNKTYLSHPVSWYKFRDHLLVYNTITDAWTESFHSPLMARAGSAIVPLHQADSKSWVVVGGESKPGVRSTNVTQVTISYIAHFGVINWIVLALYLLSMIGLGLYFMRRQKGGEDFFKGGGRIPWWAAGISIFATMLSAITYMSIPAKAYATNWAYYPMQICILVVSFPVIKYYLPFFRRLNVTSAYEYLERRFNYATRLLASLLFMVFMVARMALVLFLPSLAMTAVTGIDIYICIILMSLITIVYCTMGGMEAVVWGDVVQGIILVGGAILAAGYLICETTGGASGFFQLATENDKLQLFDWSFDYRSATFWVVILGGLANNLISYTSDQTVIQRYLTTKDEKSAARSIMTNGWMSVIVTIAFFTIGTGLYTFFKTHPASLDLTMDNTDAVFPFFMMSQLPTGIAGLLIAAIFSATMSTIGSNINSVSTAFTIDIWKKLFPSISSKQTISVARISGVISGLLGMLIAILMATLSIQSLLDYFNTILGLLSGGIGALFMMGIFFPRIGAKAALAGFIVGMGTVFYLNFYTPVNFLLFGFISILISILVALLASFLFPRHKDIESLTWSTLPKTQDKTN